jgi:Tfp pilus assembly protein PilO
MKLSTQKRNQLLLVIIGTLALISMTYFFLISPQNTENQKIADKIIAEQARLQQIKATIKTADATAQTAVESSLLLSQAEEDVATGDLYAWTYDTMRRFKTGYRVDIPSIGQPVQSEVDIIANFPYKQMKFSIIGTGYFHDLGKFVSDLENKFPHLRVVNLNLDTTGGTETANEKLSFRMELVALIKPNA